MEHNPTDRILWVCFGLTMVVYVAVFASAFWELPLNIPNWHQGLLLYFHFVPAFFWQLALCRMTGPRWRFLLPLLLLAVPVLVFVAVADWDLRAWVLAGFWCIAPLLGCALGWLVWGVVLLARRLRRPGP